MKNRRNPQKTAGFSRSAKPWPVGLAMSLPLAERALIGRRALD
jgi:hypothetical protein